MTGQIIKRGERRAVALLEYGTLNSEQVLAAIGAASND